ncbi:MAG: 30S ribosomal protein S7 [Spirochaetales bacterium]|nr:30S ribosomal protein S7 [Spirochaetales bacterium]
MPRRRIPPKRPIASDPKYGSDMIAKFVNRMILKGKKSVGYHILYDALEEISSKVNKNPLEIFTQALNNVKPLIEVKSRRVGGSTYQVPVEIKEDRQNALAMRWIISYSRQRHGKSMSEKLRDEILDAFNNTGSSVKKKEDTHKMAEANKAFAHYRW